CWMVIGEKAFGMVQGIWGWSEVLSKINVRIWGLFFSIRIGALWQGSFGVIFMGRTGLEKLTKFLD
ncbi:MAG: hypothetical protein O7G87_17830, partial [bacterium]|nr:hypothetical protein [bacterium]